MVESTEIRATAGAEASQSPVNVVLESAFDAAFAVARPRLVRLCAAMTGDALAAEDLAQETLLLGWRERARLGVPDEAGAWLAGIARNLCRRHLRARGRESAQHIDPRPRDDSSVEALPDPLDTLASPGDLAVDLEQAELAGLLDRALALLPEETRAVLVANYLQETPLADLARHTGLAEGTLRVRLHRGRLALRRVLATDLREAAVEYGAALPEDDGWRESRIYCPFCGQHTLRYRIDRATGEFCFICAGGCPGNAVAGYSIKPDLVNAVRSPKALITRHCLRLEGEYREDIQRGGKVCDCGRPVTLTRWTPAVLEKYEMAGASDATPYGIHMQCPVCGGIDNATAWHLALDTVEAQRFWKRHPRIRALPIRLVETEGHPVVVTGFESVGGQARIDILSDAESYAVLRAVTN